MPEKSIKVRATASVANVSCGFDCIGYAIVEPADILKINLKDSPGLDITLSGTKADTITTVVKYNTAGKAILSLLNNLGTNQGFNVHIEKGVPPGSGLGSSAASAAAAVVGVNELLENNGGLGFLKQIWLVSMDRGIFSHWWFACDWQLR